MKTRKNSANGYAINPRVDQETTRNTESFIDWNYFLLRSSSYFSACRFFHSTLSIIRISHLASWRTDSREILQNQLRTGRLRRFEREKIERFDHLSVFPESGILSLIGINPGNSSNCNISVPRTPIISRDRVKRKILIENISCFLKLHKRSGGNRYRIGSIKISFDDIILLTLDARVEEGKKRNEKEFRII